MHYAKIKNFDIANGVGIRTSLFVSGCSNKCKGCFNQELWDKDYGKEFTEETIKEILDSIDNEQIAGLSILGGDPLEYYNLDMIGKLIDEFRKRFGFEKSIWMWTGYLLEDIINDPRRWPVVRKVDYLVDGPFILEKRNLKLKFRGSENQRIINIQNSQTFNTLILNYMYDYE